MATERHDDRDQSVDHLTIRTRKPVGAVLSVRVPRSLAIAVDEYAREYGVRLSDVVRSAVEEYLTATGWTTSPTLYGSTQDGRLVVNSPEARVTDQTRGSTQTETREASDHELTLA